MWWPSTTRGKGCRSMARHDPGNTAVSPPTCLLPPTVISRKALSLPFKRRPTRSPLVRHPQTPAPAATTRPPRRNSDTTRANSALRLPATPPASRPFPRHHNDAAACPPNGRPPHPRIPLSPQVYRLEAAPPISSSTWSSVQQPMRTAQLLGRCRA